MNNTYIDKKTTQKTEKTSHRRLRFLCDQEKNLHSPSELTSLGLEILEF